MQTRASIQNRAGGVLLATGLLLAVACTPQSNHPASDESTAERLPATAATVATVATVPPQASAEEVQKPTASGDSVGPIRMLQGVWAFEMDGMPLGTVTLELESTKFEWQNFLTFIRGTWRVVETTKKEHVIELTATHKTEHGPSKTKLDTKSGKSIPHLETANTALPKPMVWRYRITRNNGRFVSKNETSGERAVWHDNSPVVDDAVSSTTPRP